MAKRKHGAKSAAIREHFAENPGAMPREVVAALKEKGIRVSPQMVSVLKGKMKGGSGMRGARRGRRVGNLGIEALVEAKKLADQLGGIEKAREALAVLAKLV